MFEMTDTQNKAFQAATNGMKASTFDHLILFGVAGLATIWLMLVFIGTMRNPQASPFEALNTFAFAVAVYLAVGVVVYFT